MNKISLAYSNFSKKVNQYQTLGFWILSILIFWLIGLFEILGFGPRGIHFMRQSDSLSFVMGYFQFGNGLFEPRVMELAGVDGRAAGEFPILYYLLSQVFKLTGPQFFLLRILDFLIVLLGIYAWFKLLMKSLGRFSLAYTAAWLPFSSTVFMYYATGMVPDIPALGFCLLGLASVYSAFESGKSSKIYWALFFFCFAGLTKITSLVLPLALPVLILFFYPKTNPFAGKSKGFWFLRSLAWSLIPLLLSGSWALFAGAYNQENGNTYFLTSAAPYWSLDQSAIDQVWVHVLNYWYTDYFQPDLWKFWMVLLPFSLILLLKGRDIYRMLFLPVFIGYIILFFLFFRQYQNHDYYIICAYISFALMLWSLFSQVKIHWPKIYQSFWLPLPFIIFLIVAFKYTDKGLDHRYALRDQFSDVYLKYQDYYQTLDELQIADTSSFAVIGDDTPNGILLAIRRPGYSIRDTAENENSRLMVMHQRRDFDYALAINGFDFPDTIKGTWSLIPLIQNDSVQLYSINNENK